MIKIIAKHFHGTMDNRDFDKLLFTMCYPIDSHLSFQIILNKAFNIIQKRNPRTAKRFKQLSTEFLNNF